MSELDRVRLLVPALDQLLPGFAAATAGASETAIAELQRVAGRPLPVAYLEFLRIAGSAWGTGEPVIYECRFDIKTMTQFCRDLEWPLPGRFVPFAEAENDPWEDLYLDLEQPDDELALVSFPEPDGPFETPPTGLDLMEHSFTGMLFVRTWFDYCLPKWRFTAKAQAERGPGELDRADALLDVQGWSRHPLSSRWWRLFQRQNAEVLVYEWFGRASLTIEVVAQTASEGNSIVADLARALGLEIRR